LLLTLLFIAQFFLHLNWGCCWVSRHGSRARRSLSCFVHTSAPTQRRRQEVLLLRSKAVCLRQPGHHAARCLLLYTRGFNENPDWTGMNWLPLVGGRPTFACLWLQLTLWHGKKMTNA